VFHQHLARGSLEPLEIHLQDYNDPILHLVVLPNFILTWCMHFLSHLLPHSSSIYSVDFSPAADEYRASHSANVEKKEEEEDTEDLYLDLTPSLLAAFSRSLSLQGVTLTFTSGPWSSFPPSKEKEKKYDLILTSETIYSASSHRDLIGALKASSEGGKGPLILLSSKTIYFGLPPGGDLATFLATLESTDSEDGKKGKGEVVWSNDNQSGKGVGRQIIKVSFS
jgi:protein-histidine N-methyltransferase